MQLKILPPEKIKGSIALPASKSYSIRAFFVAACGGKSRLVGSSDCDDARVALSVAKAFGARVTPFPGGYEVIMPAFQKKKPSLKVQVRESGTSLRFVLPMLPFFTARAEVLGTGTLVGRPNGHLCASLRACGLDIRGAGDKESVPVCYSSGEISRDIISIDGSVSSQFVSALMIAAVLREEDTRIVMTGKTLVSQDYVIMTRQILERAGIAVAVKNAREFVIPGGQARRGLKKFHVPSDYGLAAFWMVASALVKSDVTLKGCFDDTLVQSDGAIVPLLKRMGLRFERRAHAIRLSGPQALKGGTFSLKTAPDLVPIMAVAAMFAKGTTRLKDIAHARVKESDRIGDLRRELLKVGADIEEKQGELIIHPKESYTSGAVMDPHHDHRLAMAFAVLGLRVPLTVRDVECTSKSYPGFIKDFKSLLI